MEKEKLLRLAKTILSEVNINEIDSIEVGVNTWDDGSRRIEIEVNYPEKEVEHGS
ncbi:hypothetical protein LGV83_11545 [Enterococcus durans]|uniref:hypothetical protein n=1 Tax=Enterococcus durans TaxID=53345 RepID=UPI001EE084AF|nr:hypothetical protein [Enterococcus durans]MCG3448639.1 hypothetical protein [Enterococcus durans]MCM6856639.1 hypothetical protein [Enterococcus durans]